MSKFTPSIQQAALFAWIKTGSGSCVLEAVAGSGKTTTLVEALSLMSGKIFFGAFNKKIAEEIAKRVGPLSTAKISTMHAAGFAAWRNAASTVRVDNDKCKNIFRDLTFRDMQYSRLETQVLSLVSYAKQAGVGFLKSIDDDFAWKELIQHFDVETYNEQADFDSTDDIIMLSRKVLRTSTEIDTRVIDFDDMIYAPLFHNVRFPKYDWVLLDEAQDTNASRRELAKRLLNQKGGRLIAVGDRHQAIYGFTGADADALDLIAAEFNAILLPLTVTFRCPKSVVTYAQQWVSHIQAHDSSPNGVVKQATADTTVASLAKAGDAILCRFNAPLVKHVYAFIAAGIPARIEGKEIGQGLKALAKRWKSKTLSALLDKLDNYAEREIQRLKDAEQNARASALADKVKCLQVIIERVQQIDNKTKTPVERVCQEIDNIFNVDGDDVVILSSIHKSKGREWKTVIWLQTGPSPYAKQNWEIEQERNLCYVAATRSQETLILLEHVKDGK